MSLVLVTKSATAPSNPYDGQVWIDTTGVPALKVYDLGNTDWVVPSVIESQGDGQRMLETFVDADVDTPAEVADKINMLAGAINDLYATLEAIGALNPFVA